MTMKICYEVQKDDYDSAGRVSSQIKKALKQMGFGPQMIKRVAVSSYESEINLIIHSLGGTLCLEVDDEGIITLACDDVGPGIPNLDLAMQPGYSTASKKAREFGFGAGMGLVNMKRMSSAFDIASSGEGTHIRMVFHD